MTTLASLIANPELLTADTTVALTNKDFTAASNTLPALGAGNNTFVASGTIGNGATVALNSDGTVSVVAGVAQAVGSASVFESANSEYISAVYDANAQKIVIAYTDSGNSEYGTAVVGTVSGTSISFGAAVVFNSAGTYFKSTTFDSNSNKVVIAYKDNGNSNYGTAIVGTVSGTSISFGTPVVFESANSPYVSATFDSNNNKVVIAYYDGGNSGYGTAVVGTVSGTSISFGTPVIFESAISSNISATFDSANGKVVIAYRDDGNSSYGTAAVGTVSGTSISFGSPVIFNAARSDGMSAVFDRNSNKVVIAYQDPNNTDAGTAIVGTVSGTSISFGTAVEIGTYISVYFGAAFDSNTNKIIIAYSDNGNSGYGTAVVGTVSGTSISFTDPTVFSSTGSSWISSVYDANAQKVVIAYRDSTNFDYGTGVVLTAGSTNAPSFIGFAAEAGTDTNPVSINTISAENTEQTGLTAGTAYYVNDDGTLSTSDTGVLAGRALSTTSILVQQ